MDDTARKDISARFGALMLANVELSAANSQLAAIAKKLDTDSKEALADKDRQIAILKGELDRWQSKAVPAENVPANPYEPEGHEANGAGVH
jgi:hypothetical protein